MIALHDPELMVKSNYQEKKLRLSLIKDNSIPILSFYDEKTLHHNARLDTSITINYISNTWEFDDESHPFIINRFLKLLELYGGLSFASGILPLTVEKPV